MSRVSLHPAPANPRYTEGLRLSEAERTVLLERMKRSGVAERRRSPRMIIEGTFPVLMTMVAPEGAVAHFRIYPWDISRGGLGFFHWALIYPGTRCTFRGMDGGGKPFTITGEVVRCNHVSGNVHAVGTKLDQEIEPELLLGAQGGRTTDWWTEAGRIAGELAKLAGEHAPANAIRERAAELVRHVGTEPARSTGTVSPEQQPVGAGR